MKFALIRKILIAWLSLSLISCSMGSKNESQLHSIVSPDFSVQPEALSDDSFWTYFVGTWQDPTYRGYIKFSIVLDDEGNFSSLIWHPSSFKYHAEHLVTLPAFAGLSSQQLDSISLYNTGRRLLLGTLLIPSTGQYNHPEQIDVQLMGNDPLQPELVSEVFQLVQAHMPVAPQQVFYFPVAEQINFTTSEAARFKALGIAMAQRNSNQNRICYNAGWGVGHVRIVHAGELDGLLAQGAITSDDILVMDELPRELPVVAGIVVSQTSSPSSHPALLAGMLGIPFVYEKDATAQENWIQLAQSQSPVFFKAQGEAVGSCQFLIKSGDALTPAEAVQLSALKKPLPLQLGDFDHSALTPINLDLLGRIDAQKVGAKAANVAELRKIIPNYSIAEGLALPVGLFAQAMLDAKTADGQNLREAMDKILNALLAPGIGSKETAEGLLQLRTLLEEAKLAKSTKTLILDAIKATFPVGTKIKLRSSSNIEDQPEFNGAGLYESKGACVGDDDQETTGLCAAKKDAVIKNVQKVWASLYSLKAWVARRYYSVDESHTGMGILVQRSFKGELANGVAISSYPAYNNSGSGEQKIEVQSTGFPGEDLEVANPPAGKIPETVKITAFDIDQQIASTEVPRGRMLMTDDMYRQLYEQMAIVHAHYFQALKPKDPSQFKLDMEWKWIEKNGVKQIVIKQVRPVPMQISSTQGLDRGTLLIGERQASLCPRPSEHNQGLAKLNLSTEMKLSIALQEVPLSNALVMSNPIESLKAFGQDLVLNPNAKIQYTKWSKIWGTQNERREYTVSIEVNVDSKPMTLQWTGRQERSLAQTRLLLEGVQSIWGSDLKLVSGTDTVDYQVVLGNQKCESDAYQAFQPGSFLAASPYAVDRHGPVNYMEKYASADAHYGLTIQSRTGFQSFDKTRFLHVDSTRISGLLPRELVIEESLKAVYAPGHHNFTFEYGFDVMSANELTAAEKADLQARGIVKLVLRGAPNSSSGGPMGDSDGSVELMPETDTEISTMDFGFGMPMDDQGPVYTLYAVSAEGSFQELTKLLQTERVFEESNGGGFGIGF